MPDLTAGSRVKGVDFPPTVYVSDTTTINSVTSTAYVSGSPEVGASFTAPTTGRVNITVGGGMRNSGTGTDRLGMAPQVFKDNAGGVEVLAPTVFRGISTEGISGASGFAYRGRTSMLDGLTPGQQYYARVMHIRFAGTAGGSLDISNRDILVAPAT